MLGFPSITLTIRSFVREEDGAAGTEYAILLAAVAVAAIGAITLIGSGVATATGTVSTGLSSGPTESVLSGPMQTVKMQSHAAAP